MCQELRPRYKNIIKMEQEEQDRRYCIVDYCTKYVAMEYLYMYWKLVVDAEQMTPDSGPYIYKKRVYIVLREWAKRKGATRGADDMTRFRWRSTANSEFNSARNLISMQLLYIPLA